MGSGNQFFDTLNEVAATYNSKVYVREVRGRTVTFEDFRDHVLLTAGSLARQGVVPGSRVGIMLRNSIEFMVSWYACQVSGALAVPLNPELVGEPLEYLLSHSEATVVVCAAEFAGRLAATTDCPLIVLDTPEGNELSLAKYYGEPLTEPTPISAEMPCQILYTSGTTGRPKGVMQSAGMLANVAALGRRVGLTSEDVLFLYTPLFHGLAQGWMQYGLGLGSEIVLRERFSPSSFWDDVHRFSCTAMQHVGAILTLLLQQPERPDDRVNTMRITHGVGAPPPLWTAFSERFDVEVSEFFGMTEVGLIAFNDIPGRVGSMGKLSGLFEVRLLDSELQPVGVNERGEVWVKPTDPMVEVPKYFKLEGGGVEILDGWFRTGDLISMDADGFTFYEGRVKESLRRRGENIVPDDIERAVLLHDAVHEVAASAVPSDLGEDDVKVSVVLEEGAELDPQELLDFLKDKLPSFMVPRYVNVMKELPYTATHKLQRNSLRGLTPGTWDGETRTWYMG